MSRTLIICFFALDKTISYHKLMSSVSLFPDAHRCTFSFCYSTNCFSLIHLLVINSNSLSRYAHKKNIIFKWQGRYHDQYPLKQGRNLLRPKNNQEKVGSQSIVSIKVGTQPVASVKTATRRQQGRNLLRPQKQQAQTKKELRRCVLTLPFRRFI